MADNKADKPENGGARRSVVTIHDVARHAGVSSMTVSRVMNGKAYVSEAMRKKVDPSALKAVMQLAPRVRWPGCNCGHQSCRFGWLSNLGPADFKSAGQ